MSDERVPVIGSEKLWQALVAAGVFREGEHVRRFVIDCRDHDVPVIYVERYGDQRLVPAWSP